MYTIETIKGEGKEIIFKDGVATHQVVFGGSTTANGLGIETRLVLEEFPSRKTVAGLGYRNDWNNAKILAKAIEIIEK